MRKSKPKFKVGSTVGWSYTSLKQLVKIRGIGKNIYYIDIIWSNELKTGAFDKISLERYGETIYNNKVDEWKSKNL